MHAHGRLQNGMLLPISDRSAAGLKASRLGEKQQKESYSRLKDGTECNSFFLFIFV